MFVIDHKEKVSLLITQLFVIKQGLFFFVSYHKPFCYCNVGIHECFVINCRKGWVCDAGL